VDLNPVEINKEKKGKQEYRIKYLLKKKLLNVIIINKKAQRKKKIDLNIILFYVMHTRYIS
jgi:hypothetical protein